MQHVPIRRDKCIQYNVTSILRSGMFGIVGKQIGDSMGRSESKAAAAAAGTPLTATPDASQTVDPSSSASNAQNAGRAALVSTSSQGILGTDNTGRRKVLS